MLSILCNAIPADARATLSCQGISRYGYLPNKPEYSVFNIRIVNITRAKDNKEHNILDEKMFPVEFLVKVYSDQKY